MAGVVYFKGPNNPLSNLFPVSGGLPVWDKTFVSVEQAYQYAKARIARDDYHMSAILSCTNPWDILALGKRVPTGQAWHCQKVGLMKHLLRIKAQHCHAFRQSLRISGTKTLVEDTRQPFWAKGPHGDGKNVLGKILEDVRAEIYSGALPVST